MRNVVFSAIVFNVTTNPNPNKSKINRKIHRCPSIAIYSLSYARIIASHGVSIARYSSSIIAGGVV